MVRLHLCCGKRDFGPLWHHIDKENFPHIKSHDVQTLPYENKSVDLIYCSHGIAYFDRTEIMRVLAEWKRVLKPGSKLRIATPDFKVMMKLYLKGYPLDKFLGPMYGKMNGIYHKTTYDWYSLIEVLASVGFKKITKYDHKKTEHAEIDDHSAAYIDGVLISLNVECYA